MDFRCLHNWLIAKFKHSCICNFFSFLDEFSSSDEDWRENGIINFQISRSLWVGQIQHSQVPNQAGVEFMFSCDLMCLLPAFHVNQICDVFPNSNAFLLGLLHNEMWNIYNSFCSSEYPHVNVTVVPPLHHDLYCSFHSCLRTEMMELEVLFQIVHVLHSETQKTEKSVWGIWCLQSPSTLSFTFHHQTLLNSSSFLFLLKW